MNNPQKKVGVFRKSWHRFKNWLSDKKYNFRDRRRSNLVKIFSALMVSAVGLIIISNVLPRSSNAKSTPLNSVQAFGNQGKTVAMSSRTFNPKTGTLLLNFDLNDNSNSLTPVIDTRQIKVTFDGENYANGDQSKVFVIPTSTHTLAVQFEDIKTNFRAVKVKFGDKTLSADSIDVGPQQGASSSSRKTLETQDTFEFVVNNDHLDDDEHLPIATQKQLTLAQNKTDIKQTEKYIDSQEKAIQKWHKFIKEQNTNIDLAQENMSDVDDSSAQALKNSIESYRSQIDDAKQKIEDTQANIESAKTRIEKLQNTQIEIRNGNLNLPKPY